MSERKDEKWLDEQLQRAVDGATPVFDAQAWKQKYAKEYETLVGRAKQTVGWIGLPNAKDRVWGPGLPHHKHRDARNRWGKPHPTIRILRGPFGKIAIAAAILVAAGGLLVGRFGSAPVPPTSGRPPVALQSPAQMVSMISLSAAFQRGGIDELDRQCDRALERLGPRPNGVSMQDLLKDINGKG